MPLTLPPHAITHAPATEEALATLHTLLGPHTIHLLPLYQLTDGLETTLRNGTLHLQLFPIGGFSNSHRQHHLIIGTDTHSADLLIDTAQDPATVDLWCGFGGGMIQRLCPLPGFLAWLLPSP